MAYVINWNSAEPIGSTLPAGQLDDEIRKVKQGTEERMADIIGNNNWATNVFPVIDGSSIRSLAVLSAEVTAKASINSTNNFIPKRASAGAFADSAISDDGNTIDFSTRTTRFRGLPYNWPLTATPGFFLQYVASNGTLAWVSAAASGAIAGSGTTGKIPKFSGSTSIADSLMTESGATITIGGALQVNTTFSAASVTATGAVNAASLSVSGSISGTEVDINSLLKLNASLVTSKNTLSLANITPSGTGIAIDLNNSLGEFRVAGVRVVGARVTGWGIPTGTGAKTTFAVSTVTLSELAARVKSLIDDLTTHGLIGA